MKAAPFFSICMPAWNASAFIQNGVDSVLAQTCEDWELIVVDDHSSDGTWELLQKYAGLPRVHLLRNERNLGQTGNLNRCLERAGGEWVMFLAADDALVPHALTTIRSEVLRRPQLTLWVQNHLNRGLGRPPHLVTVHEDVREYTARAFAEMLYLKGNIFGEISNFAVRRKDLLKIDPPFREGTLGVDQRCWIRLVRASDGGTVLYWPEALTHVLEHDASISSVQCRSGEAYLDFFHLPLDLLEMGWRRRVLLWQALRMLRCGTKFGRHLPAGKKWLPYSTAWKLFRRALAGPTA